MKTSLENVVQLLNEAALNPIVVGSSDNTLLALPSYGRVLGLWSDRAEDSFFWINPEFLKHPRSAHDASDVPWANPGGDRLWLAPEREFFISDLDRPFDTYVVPRSFDPGNYHASVSGSIVTMKNSGAAKALASKIEVRFNVTRTIQPLAPDAMQNLPNSALHAAGYDEHTDLELESDCPIGVGFWNLIQVPLGGAVLIPLAGGNRYTTFFGTPDDAITCADGLLKVQFANAEGAMFKIGLRASWMQRTIAYVRDHEDGCASLIIRTFDLGSDRDYVDTRWNSPDEDGYALQLFYGAKEYNFGELEYHSLAAGGPTGRSRTAAKSRIVAFAGAADMIHAILDQMLGRRR